MLSDPPKGKTDRAALEDQASAHVVTLMGAPSEAERRAVEDWIDADPHHAVAFARMQAVWDSAERLRARPPSLDSPGLNPTGSSPPAAPLSEPQRRRDRRWVLGGAIAAGAAGVLAAGGWIYARNAGSYRTRVGEQRTVLLSDGSSVQLNTASLIRVAFARDRREVRLLHGEAHFKVAHDPARPFLVDAANARLRAIGTAFDVRIRNPAVVDLTVTQGVVAVVSAAGAKGGEPHIAAGQAAVIDGGAVAETALGGEALRRRTAWRQGVIELNGETLAQVVEEFNRYQAHPIVIGDARLETLRIGGRFQVTETDKFLSALSASFPIAVIHTGDGGVLLTSKDEKTSDPG